MPRNIITHRIGHRLAIEEFHNERLNLTTYIVRDAAWVTDAEVRDGQYSPSVYAGELAECHAFCDRVELGVHGTEPHEANFIGWPALRRRVARWYSQGKPMIALVPQEEAA